MTQQVSLPSPALQEEYRSIQAESHPELRDQELWGLASRLQSQGQYEPAAALYAELAQGSHASKYVEKAKQALAVFGGQGNFGERFAFQAQNFLTQASDPRFFAPMFLGSTVFQLGRTVALGRLAALPELAYWSRGLGARALANLTGFALEVPAFTLSQRFLVSSSENLGSDLQKTAVTLGALKLFSFAGEKTLEKFRLVETVGVSASRLASFSRFAVPQLSALLGLMTVHRVEEQLGWRAHSDFDNLFSSSLFSLLSLKVGENLTQAALGLRFATLEANLRLRAALATPSTRGGLPGDGNFWSPEAASSNPTLGPTILLMSWGKDPESRRDLIRNYGNNLGYREGPSSLSPAEVARIAGELRAGMMDEELPGAERLQYLESLATLFPALQITSKDFSKGLKDLRSLIRQPEVSFELPILDPAQVVPFYGHDHLLRLRAAELYLKSLDGLPMGAEEREALPEALRDTILDPKIPTKFKSAGQSPQWELYYNEAVRHLQLTLLGLYPKALLQLRTESPEVMEGFRFLLSPTVRALWEEPLKFSLAKNARDVAVAYARLLATASMYQRDMSEKSRQQVDLLAHLWNPILEGDDEALLVLAEAAQNDPVALKWLNRLKIDVRDPWLQDRIQWVEPEAQARQKQRHQDMVEKVAKRSSSFQGRGNLLLSAILEIFGFLKG